MLRDPQHLIRHMFQLGFDVTTTRRKNRLISGNNTDPLTGVNAQMFDKASIRKNPVRNVQMDS